MPVRSVVLLMATAFLLSGCATHYSSTPTQGNHAGKNKRSPSGKKVTRVATGKWIKSRRGVRVAALSPSLKRQLVGIGKHFGKAVHVTSGCRSSRHNRRVGGVNGSFHIRCLAADFNVPGVSKQRLANYVRNLPSRGGVGVYCGKSTVHLDVGPRRNWYRACGKRKRRADPILTSSIPKASNAVPSSGLGLSAAPVEMQLRGNTTLGAGIASLLQQNP